MPSSCHVAASGWLRAMMKNQGPSGLPCRWVCWIGAVERLLLRRQHVEVPLGGRRQRLQQHLQRVAVDAVPQVEQQHAHLGVGQEQRHDVALAQVLGDPVVVGEVAVVHQRLVHADEGMRAAGMPDAALGRVALVGDPDVRRQVLQAVVARRPARRSRRS